MKRRRLLLAGLPAALQAAPAPARLAVSEERVDGDGIYQPLYQAIAAALLRPLGLQLATAVCPLQRCLQQLREGQADLMLGLRPTAEREAYLQFLATPYRLRSADRVFYVRRGEAARLQRYEQLAALRLGVKRGASYFERLDRDSRLRRDQGLSHANNLQKLVRGHVDAVPMSEDVGLALVQRLGLAGHVELAPLREPDPSSRAIAVSRASPLLGRRIELEQSMQTLHRSGELRALNDEYFYRRLGLRREQLAID